MNVQDYKVKDQILNLSFEGVDENINRKGSYKIMYRRYTVQAENEKIYATQFCVSENLREPWSRGTQDLGTKEIRK